MSLFYLMLMLTLTSLTAIITGASVASSTVPPSLIISSGLSSPMASDNVFEEKTVEDSYVIDDMDGTVEILDTNRPSAISYCNDDKSVRIRHSRR